MFDNVLNSCFKTGHTYREGQTPCRSAAQTGYKVNWPVEAGAAAPRVDCAAYRRSEIIHTSLLLGISKIIPQGRSELDGCAMFTHFTWPKRDQNSDMAIYAPQVA